MRYVPTGLACFGTAWLLAAQLGCPGVAPSARTTPPENPNGGDPDPPPSNIFALSVARQVEQPFSNEEVDAVFAEAGRLLQTTQSECADVATDVTFARSGPVETFDVAPAVVMTEEDLNAVIALPQDIKIVHALVGVCGIDLPDDVATILGCATIGGSLVIVASAPPDVWAHEWGHVLGLGHRDDCPRNLMHSFEVETNAVNQLESSVFLTPKPDSRSVRLMASAAPAEPAQLLLRRADETLDAWLARVVRRRYRAGVPRQVAAGLGAAAVPRLMEWCAGPAFDRERPNIIRMLGLARDARACDTLVGQIVDRGGELSAGEFNSVAEAFLALGRLVEHDASGSALELLLEGTDPPVWDRRGVTWRFAGQEGPTLHRLLARLSILALGLSNSEEALEHLRELREQVAAGGPAAAEFADQIDEALTRLEGGTVLSARNVELPRRP